MWVSLLSMVYWVLVVLVGLMYMSNVSTSPMVRPAPAPAEKSRRLSDDFSMNWLACLAQGWLLIFMAVFGVYLSMREMMLEVTHKMALLGLEIITFMHYLVAGCLVLTGPWADDEGPNNGPNFNLFLTSFGQMMFIIAIALGLVHVGMACERKAMRQKQAKINAALR